MDHHEQHAQHHHHEREEKKRHEHERELRQAKQPRTMHPLWFLVMGIILTGAVVVVWSML